MIKKYKKKPIEIEAIQYKIIKETVCKYGINKKSNSMEIAKFMELPIQHVHTDCRGEYINIETSEGIMRADIGDYIIKEPFDKERGFYPCKPEIFEQTYEEVE